LEITRLNRVLHDEKEKRHDAETFLRLSNAEFEVYRANA
jgi:hypothetical protein